MTTTDHESMDTLSLFSDGQYFFYRHEGGAVFRTAPAVLDEEMVAGHDDDLADETSGFGAEPRPLSFAIIGSVPMTAEPFDPDDPDTMDVGGVIDEWTDACDDHVRDCIRRWAAAKGVS